MKIISWNIERPKIDKKLYKNKFIYEKLISLNPDILFLTETNSIIDLGNNYFSIKTENLPTNHDSQKYEIGENRVTIFSKYKFENSIETYDKFTAVCGTIQTEFGELILYGSIIGSFGGKDKIFEYDLKKQKIEIEKLKGNICYSGDFNISFTGFPYPSKKVISETNQFFCDNKLVNLTTKNKDCAIHIVASEEFLSNKKVATKMILIDRKISDHNIVMTEII
jgi:hypothetical protein